MHLAPSLVASTILTGAGFGLIVWLGLLPMDHPGWVAAIFAVLAYALAGGGLLVSRRTPDGAAGLPDLEHVRRSRTTWLTAATLVTFGAFVAHWLVLDIRPAAPLGWLVAALAIGTVANTSLTHAPRAGGLSRHTALATALFVAAALASGALLVGSTRPAIWTLAALAVVQTTFWLMTPRPGAPKMRIERASDTPRSRSDGCLALGLTGLTCAAIIPLTLLLAFPFKHALAALIVALHLIGMVTLRWHYFAFSVHELGLLPRRR